MRTATLATMTALAALLVAAPGVSTHDAEAKIRTVGKVINKGPRIRVRPRIKVNLNTKRLIDENRKTQTPSNPSAPATTQTAKKIPNRVSTTTRVSLFPQHDAAQRLAFEERDPDFSSAIEDLEGIIGAEGLGDFDVEGLAKLDVAALDPLGTGDDDSESPIPPGFESALTDPRNTGESDALDPTNSLPDQPSDNKTDSADAFRVTQDSIDGAIDGTTSSPGLIYRGRFNDNGDGSMTSQALYNRGGGINERVTTTYYADESTRVVRRLESGGELLQQRTTVTDASYNIISDECVGQECNDKPDMTIKDADNVTTTGVDEMPNPDAPGNAVIPVNCGSYDCNEARKGHKLNPGVTATGTHVNPGPDSGTEGTVAQAPRANEKYREKAVINPGTELQDNGNGNGPVGEHTPILVIGGG